MIYPDPRSAQPINEVYGILTCSLQTIASVACYAYGVAGEQEPPSQQPHGEGLLYPSALLPDLAAFLKDQDYACIAQATEQGTAFVMKIPGAEIESVRGTVPIRDRSGGAEVRNDDVRSGTVLRSW